MEFSTWLLTQQHDGPLAALQRDVLLDIADGGLPEVFSAEELEQRMLDEGATSSALDALHNAAGQWRAEGQWG